ncbi:Biotin carboxyl carrier protein of acetyl-CoA carboxylase [hydrothermal vent metagenome]|uniref:Biotin carboxyl carrier protein of acetyl-CoA carboxylase n=1 Tax=hydrothermal vent metagenome TaxID=652676 RepID=A0A3B0T8Y9_9ZZZZ
MTKSSQVDQELIRAIANLINEADLSEIEIEKDDLRIRVTRFGPALAAPAPTFVHAAPAHEAAAPAQQPLPNLVEATPAPSANEDLAANPTTLTSPMVGTVYLCPEPGTPPFVSVGTMVSEGQTVLIVEAMKTMNQIPAHRSGKITRIVVEDAQPVEYGEPLVVIE